ncbi:hypothetical protein BJ875DRAFT_481198 [Amylocarpus encephaloides]|uniref:Uncharacterized protein n=1 Tax=Amylocarpus encephaloides TaxID=45428 RepID=A0A9P7YPF2_9HELO|nr:hypothetical protein BJ875DRAFT_481198 [Amylocarpus encephaloides]
MVLELHEVDPTPEPDNSTIYTAATPPETVITDDLPGDHRPATPTIASSIPCPSSTFIIRSVATSHVLTLLGGAVILASPGGPGNIHWQCVEAKGWLGFRDPCSGKYLGHNVKGNLVCDAGGHEGWERFCIRAVPEGGFVMLMTHWERLWGVAVWVEEGVRKLRKAGDGASEGEVWEFVKV